MDFIKYAAKQRFDLDYENTAFSNLDDKDESTLRQYNSMYRKLVAFIQELRPKVMSINLTVSFFKYLHESGLAPGTITTAKSALHQVFSYGFDINLNDRLFTAIPKVCSKRNF